MTYTYHHDGRNDWSIWKNRGTTGQTRICSVYAEADAAYLCALLSQITEEQKTAAVLSWREHFLGEHERIAS